MRDKDFETVGQGSGFFVSSDGLVVTNYHAIESGDFASVLLSNNATYFVDGVVAIDEENDLALLKVNGDGLPEAALSEGEPPTRVLMPEPGGKWLDVEPAVMTQEAGELKMTLDRGLGALDFTAVVVGRGGSRRVTG